MTERHNRLQAGNQFYHQGGLDDGTWAFDAFNTASLDASPFNLNSGTPVISPGAAGPSLTQYQQVVFIEGDVPDAHELAAGVTAGTLAVILNPNEDGVAQIAAFLTSHDISNLTAIDIVAHGENGMVQLGAGTLSSASLPQYQTELSTIGAALQHGGDIQIFGCDVAQDKAGVAFLDQLSAATGGANVAAASHLVGAASGGGSWDLDVNTGAIDASSPFTATAEAAYPAELPVAAPSELFLAFNVNYINGGASIEKMSVSGSNTATGATSLANSTDNPSFSDASGIYSIVVEAPQGKYYVVNDDAATGHGPTDQILVGTIGSGTLAAPSNLNFNSSTSFQPWGIAESADPNVLYAANYDPANTALNGIWSINLTTGATAPVAVSSLAEGPIQLAIDQQNSLGFFTDTFNTDSHLEVGNLVTGTVQVLYTAPTNEILYGVAVVAGTNGGTVYFDSGSDETVNGIYEASYTLSGGEVTLGTINTLYSLPPSAGSSTVNPMGLAIDPTNGVFYIGNDQNSNVPTWTVYEGSLAGASAQPNLVEVYSSANEATLNPETDALYIETTPTVATGGAVTYISGHAAVTLDSTATAANPDGEGLASATVSITGGLASGDTLNFENGASHFTFTDGDTINASFSGGVLSLTGDATAADYQSALDTVAFSTTSTSAADRTVSWSVSDGILSSAISTSTVHILGPPAVTSESHTSSSGSHIDAGKTVTFSVTFSAPVTVTTGVNGAATLQLNDSEVATYSSGSGTNTLTFSYTVQPGDTQTDLKATSFVALPTGTTIKDGSGQNADLSGFTAIDTGVQVDTTAPGVTSVGVPANATYIAGQDLDFTVHLSEAVTVTGTPEIALTLDTGGTVDAQYVSGSGTSALVFSYAVIGGEADTNGIGVGNAIILNGGTVQDAATNAAVLTLNNVGLTGGVLVDSIPPTVSSVSVPTDGVYSIGQTLAFTVNFSENVLVTTGGGGAPYIDVTLDTGGTVHAVYTGGSGTSALTFAYTIASGNDDANGVAVGSSINLNGGTINDAATNAAVPTLNSVGSTTGVLVHAIPPTVTSIDTVDNSTNNLGTEHFMVTFSEAVTGVDASDFTLVGTGTVGGAITSVSGSGTTWTVTVGNVVGDGALRLDLNNAGDAITDTYGNTLAAAHTGDQSYTIEHTPPSITAMTVPADATYVAGDHLDFTATFSEAVTVTGTPRIALTLDTGGTVYATCVSGSGTNTLTFQYTVAPGNQDLTGITTASAIDLNGGTIKDAAANDAVLTLVGEPSTAGIDVDAIVPAVSSVSVPSNGTYGTGQDLDFTVDFTKVVTVNTGGGTPSVQVTLDTGGTVDATYLSGSGTSALVFRYVVASGELDSNGITVGTSLALNGATIQDSIGNNAVPALNNIGSTTGVLVDSILPTVTSIDTVDAATNNLHTEYFTVTFSTDVSLAPPDTTDFTLHTSGTASGAISSVTAVSGNTYTVTVTGVNGDGTMRLDLNTSGTTITDAYGNPVTSGHTGDQSYTIDHTAPAAPTLALTHDTGASNTDNITGDPSLTYSTPVAGDTLLYKVDGGSYSATAPVFATDHSADGSHTVSVEEVDAAGNVSSAASLSFTLDTTAPAAPTLALTHDTGVSNTDHLTSDPSIAYALSAAGDSLLFKVDGGSYSATVPVFATNGSADGLHTVSVEEVDAAGNVSAAASLSFTLDTANPTVSVTADHNALLAGQTALMTFTFSEAVSGFGLGDTTVSGGSLSNLVQDSHNADVYIATFTPNASNTEAGSVEVNASSYTDIAGNHGAASNTVDLTGDTLAPTAVATALPSSGTEVIGDLVQITLTFGEAVTIAGSTPALALNDGGTATYDAAATAALHDAGKLVFDYTVASSDANTSPLAITGVAHGTTITDLAGNAAGVAATLTGLGVVTSLVTANPDTNHVVANQTVTADAAHGVLANDPDTNPADHVVVSAVDGLAADVGQPIAGAYGTLTLHADGSYVYAADNAATGEGTDTFTYTASNGHGPDSTSTLTITVSGANQSYVQVPSGGSATGGYNNTVLDGSAGGATLTAAETFNAHQILVGGPGDILNAASFGQDTFVFADNFGHETVNNFHPALDVIQLQQSQFASIAAVMADIQQVGADSVLTLDANHVITITNTPHASLTASDFHLV